MRDPISAGTDRAGTITIDRPAWRENEERWKALTRTANAAFERGEVAATTEGYRSALRIAEDLLDRAEQACGPAHAPALLVVTHHNIAEAALAQGRGATALDHYRSAFERLLRSAASTAAPVALRQSCASHLQPALVALATHLRSTGAPTDVIARDIRRARRIVVGPMARA